MKLSSDKHHLWKLSAAFSSSPCTCGWLTRFPRSSNVIVFSLIVAVRICLLEYVIHSDTHMNQRPRSILLKLRDPLAITSMGHGSKNLTFGLCHFILFQMNQWNHSGTPWSTHVFDAIFSHDLDRSWPWWVMAKVTGRKSPFEVSANHLHVEIVVKCEILMKQTGNRNLQWKGQMWWVYRNGSSNVCYHLCISSFADQLALCWSTCDVHFTVPLPQVKLVISILWCFYLGITNSNSLGSKTVVRQFGHVYVDGEKRLFGINAFPEVYECRVTTAAPNWSDLEQARLLIQSRLAMQNRFFCVLGLGTRMYRRYWVWYKLRPLLVRTFGQQFCTSRLL